MLAAIAGIAGLGIGGSLIYALESRKTDAPAEEIHPASDHATPDGLAALPMDYGSGPKLGPPLPGDLGPPILAAQTGAPSPIGAGEAVQYATIDETMQRVVPEREAARTARRSRSARRGWPQRLAAFRADEGLADWHTDHLPVHADGTIVEVGAARGRILQALAPGRTHGGMFALPNARRRRARAGGIRASVADRARRIMCSFGLAVRAQASAALACGARRGRLSGTEQPRRVSAIMNGQAQLDARAFRAALGEFVTGVTIITTCDAHGRPAGLTANSFNSVSLDPPLILFSLALDSASLDTFRQASWWAVHVLASDQEDLSNRFARRDIDKFAGVAFTAGPGGIPLLEGFAARFVCHSAFEYEGGDHAIFLGEVREFTLAGRPPLIYHKGRYGGILPQGPGGGDVAASIDAMAEMGLVAFSGARAELTERGRNVVQGLALLADGNAAFSAHERAALRALLMKL